MSLVPYPDLASLPEEARTAIEQAPVQLNIFKMMANAETCFIPLSRLGVSILSRQKLDPKLRELVILRVAQIEGGQYEWIQHVPIAISVGATQMQVDAIERNTIDPECFSDVERAAMRFTEEVVRIKMMHNVSGTTITQQAIAHFLGIGRFEYHLKKLRKALHTQCLRYMQGILQYFPPGTKVSRPQGGFVLWVELDRQLNAYRLYQEALKHNVSVAPGQLFSAQGQFGNCLRISYARPWDQEVEEGLRLVGKLVAAQTRTKTAR